MIPPKLSRFRWIVAFAGLVVMAQTRVDLGRQTQSADLSGAGPTKPMQTGTVLPAQCSVGEMFFKTDATPGSNVYACALTNTWLVSSGSGGGGGLTTSGGAIAGNFLTFLDGSGTQVVDSGIASSPTNFMNQFVYQSGTALDCVGQGTDTGSAMSCLLTPTLSAYALHMPLRLTPQTGNSGAFTLDIDSIGAVGVKEADCTTDPSTGYFQPGQTYFLTYNGSVFCEAHAGGTALQPAAPYDRIQAAYYLPFGYAAEMPPTVGWTAVNFTGATFTTSGMGGAVQIQTPVSRTGESLSLQTRVIGGGTTLEAVLASAGLGVSADFGACGIGVQNAASSAAYLLMQQLQSVAGPLREAGYVSSTEQAFVGNTAVSGFGNVVFLKIAIVGSSIVSSYSPTGGPNSWMQINSRALGSSGMPATVDRWVFMGEASGSSPAICQLLSWRVQ